MKRLFLIFWLLAGLNSWAADNYDSRARSRKSDYYFLEGLRQRALGREDLSAAMMARAYRLNPRRGQREAYELGSRMMAFASAGRDSTLFRRGVELCEEYFAENPEDAFAGTYLAQYYTSAGDLPRAKAIYSDLCRRKPNNPALTANYAEILMRTQDFGEAIEVYRNLEKHIGRTPALTQRITNVMIWRGDTLAALREVDDLLAAQPRSVEALLLAASASSQFASKQRAEDYRQRIRQGIMDDNYDRDEKLELLRFAVSAEMRGDSLSASTGGLFESLVGQFPSDYELRMLYMSYLAANKQWAEAASQAERAVQINPTYASDFVMLARLYGSADDFDGVLKAVELGLEHHPQALELYLLKSGVQSRRQNYAAAFETLSEAEKIDSLIPAAKGEIIRSMADIGQQANLPADSIKSLYERALTLNADDDLAMNNYAYFLATSPGGDLLRAKDLISKAVVFEPGSATYYDTYAWVCFRLGDLENAKRYIDMAILFDKLPDESSVELTEHAVEIYKALGLTYSRPN